MTLPDDARFRHGLASCLAGIAVILLGLTLGVVGGGFFGLLVAIAGAGVVILGAADIERSARSP